MSYPLPASLLTAFLLASLAGSVAPAGAMAILPLPSAAAREDAVAEYRSASWLSDRKVMNNNGEEIATVSDLILDRGSGHIQYLVIKTGATFGLGGRAVAIPYSAFRWETTDAGRFVLPLTAEQLKQYAEYTSESWKAMKESKPTDANALREKLEADSSTLGDPFAGSLDTARKERVTGEIKTVERIQTSTFGEQVRIGVLTKDGSIRHIALGPSWYVNGTALAPMRGDKVDVETLQLPRDPDQLLAGTEIRNGERSLRLRDTDGSPVWALKTVEHNGRAYPMTYSRYLLASDLHGMKIDCRGHETGRVHDIILERKSGNIAFLSIDPNQNFLGMGDTKRLLPWSVATVLIDETVRIDASKDMVLASPETPSDIATLNGGTHAERVYKAFAMPTPSFEPVKLVPVDAPASASGWSPRGTILGAIDPASSKTLSGKVIDITQVSFERGVRPARALRIKPTADGSAEEVVLLGPAWYMENQQPICQNGDTVTIEAVQTKIDGSTHWLARSITGKGPKVILIDKNNNPAWSLP